MTTAGEQAFRRRRKQQRRQRTGGRLAQHKRSRLAVAVGGIERVGDVGESPGELPQPQAPCVLGEMRREKSIERRFVQAVSGLDLDGFRRHALLAVLTVFDLPPGEGAGQVLARRARKIRQALFTKGCEAFFDVATARQREVQR